MKEKRSHNEAWVELPLQMWLDRRDKMKEGKRGGKSGLVSEMIRWLPLSAVLEFKRLCDKACQ